MTRKLEMRLTRSCLKVTIPRPVLYHGVCIILQNTQNVRRNVEKRFSELLESPEILLGKIMLHSCSESVKTNQCL